MLKGDRIFWDLDGVLRDLVAKFGCYVDAWDKVNGSGKSVIEHVQEDMSVLVSSPETEYVDLAREFSPIHIVSAQPDTWRKNTSKWLDNHLPDARVKYLTDTQHKLKYLECGTRVLIEDYPNYPDYSNIILIDRPWNKDTQAPCRVYNPIQLKEVLIKYLETGSL